MRTYTFILTPWSVSNNEFICDILEQTLEHSIVGVSFKDALRQLYKSIEFDEYIHINSTVWVYWKSYFNEKLFYVPDFEDVDIQKNILYS